MKTVIIVSKCLRVTNLAPDESSYEFHFKGVCAGMTLKKVILRGKHIHQIKRGEEFLLHVNLASCDDGVLTGVIIKARLLDECWNRA